MGVKGLWVYLSPAGRKIPLEALEGQVLAIDASIWAIQFLHSLPKNNEYSVVEGFMRRICKLLYFGIKPVVVFDGQTPFIKRRTLMERRAQRMRLQVNYNKAAERILHNVVKDTVLQRLMQGKGQEQLQVQEEVEEEFVPEFEQEQKEPSEISRFLVEKHRRLLESHSIDLETFLYLDLEEQYDLVEELEALDRDQKREQMVRVQDDLGAFSKVQVDSFIRQTKERIRQKQIMVKASEAELQRQGFDRDEKPIVSNQNLRYIYRENNDKKPVELPSRILKAIEKGKQRRRAKGKNDIQKLIESQQNSAKGLVSVSDLELYSMQPLDIIKYQNQKNLESKLQEAEEEEPPDEQQERRRGQKVQVEEREVEMEGEDWLYGGGEGEERMEERVIGEVLEFQSSQEYAAENNESLTFGEKEEVKQKHQVEENKQIDPMNSDFNQAYLPQQHFNQKQEEKFREMSEIIETSPNLDDRIYQKEYDASIAVPMQWSPDVRQLVEKQQKIEKEPELISTQQPLEVKPQESQEKVTSYATSKKRKYKDVLAGDEEEKGFKDFDDQVVQIKTGIDRADEGAYSAIERMKENILEENIQLIQELEKNSKAFSFFSQENKFDIKELLEMFGIPYIDAPFEAESQCAYLEQNGFVDGVITEDSDCLLFGASKVYRNIFEKNKFVEKFDMQVVKKELGCDREELIKMALFMGSDYTLGVKGIAHVNAVEIVNSFQGEDGLKRFREWADIKQTIQEEGRGDKGSKKKESRMEREMREVVEEEEDRDEAKIEKEFKKKHKNLRIHWEFPSDFPSDAVVKAYKSPNVQEVTLTSNSWKEPDFSNLAQLAITRFGWGERDLTQYITLVKKKMEERKEKESKAPKKGTLDAYFEKKIEIRGEKFANIKSRRVEKAVNQLKKRNS